MKKRLLLDGPGRKFDMAIGNSGAKDGELDSNWPKAACAQYATLTFRAAKTSRLRPLASHRGIEFRMGSPPAEGTDRFTQYPGRP
jgi:hypothetical protein